jgi:hypothetical protein
MSDAKGFKTGDGLPLTSIASRLLRKAYGLKVAAAVESERGFGDLRKLLKKAGLDTE